MGGAKISWMLIGVSSTDTARLRSHRSGLMERNALRKLYTGFYVNLGVHHWSSISIFS